MKLGKMTGIAMMALIVPVLLALKGVNQDTPVQKFEGKWVMTVSGKTFLVLSIKVTSGQLAGVMTMPEHFQMDAEGNITNIAAKPRGIRLVQATGTNPHVQLLETGEKDPERFELTFVDDDNILLRDTEAPVPPWKLTRVDEKEDIQIASQWRVNEVRSKEITVLQEELRRMVAVDQAARTANPVSIKQMQRVDEEHYPRLLEIYKQYGWPTFTLVGKEAARDYWLLVQHQRLDLQKMVLPDMERAVAIGEASKADFAELYDRVMVYEGKPQRWGTQAKCENGKAVLYDVDDPPNLERRRAEMNLLPVDEYLQTLCQATLVPKKQQN